MASESSDCRTRSRSRAWPHHQVAMFGSFGSRPRIRRASAGMKPSMARDSSTPEPSALATVSWPARTARSIPGTPMVDSARSSSGSAYEESSRRHSTSSAAQAVDGADVQRVVAHHEVAALDQQEARGSAPGRRARSRFRSCRRASAGRPRALPERVRPARPSRKPSKNPASRSTLSCLKMPGKARDSATRFSSA